MDEHLHQKLPLNLWEQVNQHEPRKKKIVSSSIGTIIITYALTHYCRALPPMPTNHTTREYIMRDMQTELWK